VNLLHSSRATYISPDLPSEKNLFSLSISHDPRSRSSTLFLAILTHQTILIDGVCIVLKMIKTLRKAAPKSLHE
jgi:hypothetical protein